MSGRLDASQGTCPLCGGTLTPGLATIPLVAAERVITVRAVPAEVCGDCGEAYLQGNVVDGVQKLVDELRALETEVSVVRYRAA